MNVEVTIVVSTPPIKKNLDGLKSAASRLTNNKKSITVRVNEQGDRFSLTTNFTMKTAAQYKVVDDIASEFEFWTFDLQGYQDMSISFPNKRPNSSEFNGDDWLSSGTLKF
jgi:hypothetical protein